MSATKSLKAEENQRLAIYDKSSGQLDDLEERVKSMMEKSQNKCFNGKSRAYICKVCGKGSHVGNIRDHIEANHLDGIAIPCNHCDRTFRSRNALRQHKNNVKMF